MVDHRLAGQNSPKPQRHECPICHIAVVSETTPVCAKDGIEMVVSGDLHR